MGYVDKALSAHLRSTLHSGFTSMNGKVADITHADTAKHTITLAEMGLPSNAIALILLADRISGTGSLNGYPNEGTKGLYLGRGDIQQGIVFGIINERLEYSLSTSGDDWDLFCLGYWTSGRVPG